MRAPPSPPDLSRVPRGGVTRFAPSPTGELHLGHVANVVWVWGVAGAIGARVLLRIDDHDRGRSRPAHEAQILQDLEWLGVEPAQTGPVFRHSDHPGRYESALARLERSGSVYVCQCSRRDIARRARADGVEPDELRYPGTCRELGLEGGVGRTLRIVLPDQSVGFTDLLLGPTIQVPAAQCGDLSLKDGVANWTYQFSVTVDDLVDGVTLVIRGEDLVSSTGRQILLGRMLGREDPASFLHHPLIRNDAGVKLSKRDGAPGLARLRRGGSTREQVLGEAAFRTGLLPASRPIGPDELGGLFTR
jgi:glutamyl/glutaminyl-tRNA synthetase